VLKRRLQCNGTSIVPRDTVTSRALLAVIAIMTFVAALIVGAVGVVRDAATHWRTDMVREVTIQVRPVEGRDIAAEIGRAIELARRTRGVVDARSLTREETGRLLEPWLGNGVDLAALPLPRLIVVRLSETIESDLAGLRQALAKQVTTATLDDHRTWSERLASISDAILIAGSTVLILVLLATMLSVSFATRGAVATNRTIVEVLHFVGARNSFIAGTFQRHFLAVGLKGGLIGGAAAALLFAFTGIVPGVLSWLPGGDEAAFLTGQFALDRRGYLGIAGIVVLVALVTTFASRITVRWTLREID
jgi:cell division transport system permease protein